MRKATILAIAIGALVLGACATAGPDIPADAVSATHTEANGDVVTEYRVGNQLRVVQVQPLRGPVYYLYDKDGDGIVDKAGDNPPQTYFKLFSWWVACSPSPKAKGEAGRVAFDQGVMRRMRSTGRRNALRLLRPTAIC